MREGVEIVIIWITKIVPNKKWKGDQNRDFAERKQEFLHVSRVKTQAFTDFGTPLEKIHESIADL